MNRSIKIAGLIAVGVTAVGCSDFLTGPGISDDPNRPVVASPVQLFVAAQAQGFVRQQGQLARTAGMLVQQISGINNQQKNWVSDWQGSEGDYSGQFNAFYTGGGLVDWRKVQAGANAAGDPGFEGIAKVWEAYMMGTAASIWGDIPYREAVGEASKPALDPQQQVYADMQALLDEAIGLLGTSPSAAAAAADLVYGGNTGRWVRAANTLKARYHLHTAERLGAPAYQAALSAALNGINEAPTTVEDAVEGQAPGNFRALHGSALENANIWAQFLNARQDIVAGKRLVDILNARGNDPRLAGYFDPASGGVFRGANQFGIESDGTASLVAASPRRTNTFRQPLITWAENQLIIAEAKHQLGDATAIDHLNAVRESVGLPDLAGPITLEDIMTEKYIVMFQNIEAWNDFKRTCIPALSPGGAPQLDEVPGRVPYGAAERQNNPNIPSASAFPEGTTASSALRNWNDPSACPVPAS